MLHFVKQNLINFLFEFLLLATVTNDFVISLLYRYHRKGVWYCTRGLLKPIAASCSGSITLFLLEREPMIVMSFLPEYRAHPAPSCLPVAGFAGCLFFFRILYRYQNVSRVWIYANDDDMIPTLQCSNRILTCLDWLALTSLQLLDAAIREHERHQILSGITKSTGFCIMHLFLSLSLFYIFLF